MELRLCVTVESSCLPTHNIAPHISLHDLPHHKTRKKHEDFEGIIVFLFSTRNFAIRTWFCDCPQYLCLFCMLFECNPSIHDQGKMLVLPNRLLSLVFSTLDPDFSFCPAVLISSTYTDKIDPFSSLTNKHSQFGTFSHPHSQRTFLELPSP